MKYNNQNPQGFTLLLILGVIGFLLILLTGIYKVVLFELEDTKNMSYFMQSRSASEAGGEIAMLKLKENGFGYQGSENYDKEGESIMLSDSPLDNTNFNPNSDVFFGYEIDSKSNNYSGEIESGNFQIIPLFYKEDNGRGDTKKPVFTITSGEPTELVWNIIGSQGGMSGKGNFDSTTLANSKTINSQPEYDGGSGTNNNGFLLETISVNDFLRIINSAEPSIFENYLTIYNVGAAPISYTITSDDSFFTKPVTKVYSSAKIGEIKQNIELEIENSKYFDVLKYSIYDY